MKSKNEDTLLKEFERMPKQCLSDSAKHRMLSEIEEQKTRPKLRPKHPRWIVSTAAGAVAVIIAVGGIYGISDQTQHRSSTTTANRPTHQVTGYDYQKLLGFQPMLPAKVPSGYILKNIQTEIDILNKVGNIYAFYALYQNGNSAFGVSELKATGHATIHMPSSTQKISINGVSGVSYNQDGYTLQFTQGGITYRVKGEENADQDQQDVMAIASSLTVPAQKKPDQTIRRSFK
ncbi:hypothetical protein LLE49_27985 [Alicyclobacillus tolerans]|uniref:hypothetical protein n=1 Tax=Alicyclobacillus tolerans TaxID=90970 RepID=UPI001F445CA4|nr:hypothetical protein [Alicyclobacillus tolerans]MCF8568564.1 hypothetical protein [Alicyclobacillus tolerans]